MSGTIKAWAGIDPKTKVLEVIGTRSAEVLADIQKDGFIAVAADGAKAKERWGEVIENIYDITEK